MKFLSDFWLDGDGLRLLLIFTKDEEVIKKILKHLGLWNIKARPPLKRANAPPVECHIDYSDSHVPPCEVYPPLEGLSLLRSGLSH